MEYDGMNWHKDKFGYWRHSIYKSNNILLHRYIWEKHNGSIPEGYVIHHIDGDKSNNNIENLQKLKYSKHLSIHNSGKTISIEHRLKISKANKGKKHSITCRQIRSINSIGILNPFFNKKHSPETKQKMKDAWILRRLRTS